MQLVDERDDLAVGVVDLLEHRLQPLLELAAVLRARDESGEIQRHQLLALERVGHVARDVALREASTTAVLPTPGSPMSTGLFLVGRVSTWLMRRISASRPMTGSSLPLFAISVRFTPYCSSAVFAFSSVAGAPCMLATGFLSRFYLSRVD